MAITHSLFLEKLELSQSRLTGMPRRPGNDRVIEPFHCKVRVAEGSESWNPWTEMQFFIELNEVGQIIKIGFAESVIGDWAVYTLENSDENLIFSKDSYWLQIDHASRMPDELVDRIRKQANVVIDALAFQSTQDGALGSDSLSDAFRTGTQEEGAGLALMQVFEDDLRSKIFEFRAELKRQHLDVMHYGVAIRSGLVDISVAIAADEFYLHSFPSIDDMRSVVIKSVKVMFKVAKGSDAPALDALHVLLAELFEAVFDAQSVDSLEYLTCLFDSVWYEIDFSRASMVVESIFQRKLLAKNMQKIMTNV